MNISLCDQPNRTCKIYGFKIYVCTVRNLPQRNRALIIFFLLFEFLKI